jgi:RHS repeat-associated protein
METGRFISRDPLSAMPGWVEDAYMYASANPVNLVDPLQEASRWRNGP